MRACLPVYPPMEGGQVKRSPDARRRSASRILDEIGTIQHCYLLPRTQCVRSDALCPSNNVRLSRYARSAVGMTTGPFGLAMTDRIKNRPRRKVGADKCSTSRRQKRSPDWCAPNPCGAGAPSTGEPSPAHQQRNRGD